MSLWFHLIGSPYSGFIPSFFLISKGLPFPFRKLFLLGFSLVLLWLTAVHLRRARAQPWRMGMGAGSLGNDQKASGSPHSNRALQCGTNIETAVE